MQGDWRYGDGLSCLAISILQTPWGHAICSLAISSLNLLEYTPRTTMLCWVHIDGFFATHEWPFKGQIHSWRWNCPSTLPHSFQHSCPPFTHILSMRFQPPWVSVLVWRAGQACCSMSDSNWSRAAVEKLIELYRQHECLWRTTMKEYKNSNLKERALKDIETKLGARHQPLSCLNDNRVRSECLRSFVPV